MKSRRASPALPADHQQDPGHPDKRRRIHTAPLLQRLSQRLAGLWPGAAATATSPLPAKPVGPQRQRPASRPGPVSDSYRLEALEPRVLLSADVAVLMNAASLLSAPLAGTADTLLPQQAGNRADGAALIDWTPVAASSAAPAPAPAPAPDAITVAADGDGNVTLTLTADANDATLTFDADSGKLALLSNIAAPGVGAFENYLFNAPLGKTLTINTGFGADKFKTSDLAAQGSFALVINDPDNLRIDGNVLLAGSLSVTAGGNVTVADGARLQMGGALALTADAGYASTWTAVTPVYQSLNANVAIDVGANATLSGASVSLRVASSNARQADFEIDEIALQGFNPAQLANIFVPALPPGVAINFADGGGNNPDTISRTDVGGDWLADGFAIGQTIEVAGTASNNGFFQIASINATVITLTSAATLTTESAVDGPLLEVVILNTPSTISFNDNGLAADTIVRASGSWLADGFKQYQTLTISGTPDGADTDSDGDNDGEYLIASITANTITLQPADALVQQSALVGVQATAQGSPGDIPLAVVDANVTFDGHVPLTFADVGGADTISRADAGGSWIADGFVAGQQISVTDSGLNDGGYQINSVTTTTITLTSAASLKAEVAQRADVTSVNSLEGGQPTRGAPLQDEITADATFSGSTVTLDSGVWAAGYAVGQQLSVTGSTANDGFYRITAVSGNTVTVQASLVTESGVGLSFGHVNAVTLTFSGFTITRSAGSWAADGFAVGQQISVDGSFPDDPANSNNGGFRIAALSGTVLTVALPGFTGFTTDSTQSAEVTYIASQANALLVFDAAAGTITRGSGSWLDDGFVAGRKIVVDGAQENSAMFLVDSISLDGRTLHVSFPATSGLLLVNELVRFAEVKGILPNSVVNPGSPGQSPTAGSVFTSLAGALPTNALANFGTLTGVLKGKFASAVEGSSISALRIASGAQVLASGNISLVSHAESNVAAKTKGIVVGITYGRSDATATLDISAGAVVNAGGDVAIAATVDNTLAAATKVVTGFVPLVAAKFKRLVPGPALGVSYGAANSLSQANVADGASVVGNNVAIRADNNNSFSVITKSKVNGIAKPNLGNALALSISDVTSNANATVNGDITSRSGSLTVDAESINLSNRLLSATGIKRVPKGAKQMSSVAPNMAPSASAGQIGLAAGITVAISDNHANALVGSGAQLLSDGDLTVRAYAEDNYKVVTRSAAKLASTVAISGGISVTDHINEATARVDNGAVINARGVITVKADAVIPNQVTIDDRFRELVAFRPSIAPAPVTDPSAANASATDPVGSVTSPLQSAATGMTDVATQASQTLASNMQLLALLKPFIKYKLIVQNEVATFYAQSSAGGIDKESKEKSTVAISGTVSVNSIANTARASIGQGALVNQDPTLVALALQAVAVKANSSIETVAVGGMADAVQLLLSFKPGGKSTPGAVGNKGENTIGGSYLGINYAGTAEAWVEDGAKVKAKGDVSVTANQHDLMVAVAQAGGKAQNVGVSGAALVYGASHHTRAWVEDRAEVDAGGRVNVLATADTLAVGVAGAFQAGGVVSIGAALNYNNVANVTEAFIGNRLASPSILSAGHVRAGGDVNVLAGINEQFVTVAIAGSYVQGSTGSQAGGSGGTPSPVSTGGVGVSGAVSLMPR